MTRLALVGAALLLVTACGSDNTTPTSPSNAGGIVLTAVMSAANEVPPITNAEANARGLATITLDVPHSATGAITGAGTIAFTAQLANFPAGTPVTFAHIHAGTVGVAGSVVINTTLSATSPIVIASNGTATLNIANIAISQAEATSLAATPAAFYFDVHTTLNPTGAIRGQLAKQ